jgi:copper chaperone CopZ
MKLEGVKKADVGWKKGEVVVEYDPTKVTVRQMVRAVNESGVFKAEAVEKLSDAKSSQEKRGKKQITR